MANLPVLKIFLSSPGDVAEERALAEIVFRRLAVEMADIVRLELVIWEHEPLFGHTGFQHQIERPSLCDLVICILWSRLGTRLPSDFAAAPGVQPPTGTEFEIEDALQAFARTGKPHLLVYRKIPAPQIGLGSADFSDRSDQYRRLDDFCRRAFQNEAGAITAAHTTFSDSHTFERRLSEHAQRWLERQLHSSHAEGFRPLWRKSPFRGLQAFEAEHQAIFFGRSEALGSLMRRIRDTEAAENEVPARLLLVQGMSGAGKTSLFKAGLLPLLDLRPVEGIALWTALTLRPSEADPSLREFGPLGLLAVNLCERVPAVERLGTTRQKLAELLKDRPQEAVARIETCIAADADRQQMNWKQTRLILYIDQLEEMFSVPDCVPFGEALLNLVAAMARSPCMWVAATLRSDFMHRLEPHAGIMACIGQNPAYTLLPPRTDELAEMIREPARAAGLIWEHKGGISLDQELLRDSAGYPEALPLLEYTLAELYEKREGRLLRWSDYGGGLRGALISAADEVVTGSSGDVEAAFRDVMRELVSVADDGTATRRYASLSRFTPGGDAKTLLDRLVARRLCVTSDEGRGEGPVACLSHEALIRSWPRAQAWLQKETTLLRLRDEVAHDAAAWDLHDRIDGWLGAAPEKLSAIRQVEQARLMPSGVAAQYAQRSRRHAARNRIIRTGVIATIGVLSIVATGAAFVAQKQRDRARTEAQTADQAKGFLVSLFELADPGENRGEQVSAKQMLDKGAQKIRTEKALNEAPEVRAELLTAMGQAYSGLGLYESAEKLLTEADTDSDAARMPPESRVRTLVAAGRNLYLAGKYDESKKLLAAAVDLARRKLEPADVLRSEALVTLAELLADQEQYAEAKALCEESLVADRKRGNEYAAVTAKTLYTLGKTYFENNELTAAEPPLREALKLREEALGERHAATAESINALGALLYQSGRYPEAIEAYQKALPIYRNVYGNEHPEVAAILNNLGRSALIAGQVDEAEPQLRESVAMTEKFQGVSHVDLIAPLNSLAMIDKFRGHIEVARAEIDRAERIASKEHNEELLDQVLLNKADLALTAGSNVAAVSLLAQSRQLLEKLHPPGADTAWRYAVWDSVNAQVLAAGGNLAVATKTLSEAQAILQERFGSDGFFTREAERKTQLLAVNRRL